MRRLAAFLEAVAISCLLLMTAFITLAVLARNVLAMGLPWAEELARYCSVSLVFLAAPALLADRAHVAVDFAVRALPPSVRGLVARVTLGLVALFCAIFLVAGWQFISGAWRFATPALGIPNWLFYAPVFLGVLLMGCLAVRDLARPAAPTGEEREEA